MIISETPKGGGRKGGKTKKRYCQFSGRKTTVTNYATQFDDKHVPTPSSPFQNTGFFLKWVSRRISVGEYQRPIRTEEARMCPPPYDICLARKERRPYQSPVDETMKLGRAYDCHYHLRKSCNEKADPPV